MEPGYKRWWLSFGENVGVVDDRNKVGRKTEPALHLEDNGGPYIVGLRPCSASDDIERGLSSRKPGEGQDSPRRRVSTGELEELQFEGA